MRTHRHIVGALVDVATRPLVVVVQLVARRTCALEAGVNVATMIAAVLQFGALVDVNAFLCIGRIAEAIGACAPFVHGIVVVVVIFGGVLLVVHFVGGRLLAAVRADGVDTAVRALLADLRIDALVDVCRMLMG